MDEEPSFTEIPQDEALQFLSDDLIERESVCTAVSNEFCVTSHGQPPLSIVNISVNNRKWRSRAPAGLLAQMATESRTRRSNSIAHVPVEEVRQQCFDLWVPACAESTPRIEKKCSGGNDRGGSTVFVGACVRSVDNGTRRWYKMNIKEHRGARVNSENRSAEILKEVEVPGSIS